MKKQVSAFLLFAVLTIPVLGGSITSLSQLFALGKGLADNDHDGLADSINLAIIVPDIPNQEEIALAADIAARTSLESLSVDFSLVHKESQAKDLTALHNVIWIGGRSRAIQQIRQASPGQFPSLSPSQGMVQLLSNSPNSEIVLLAGSPSSLVKTGHAFFLRWPYLWDIWGRESGATYEKVIKDITDFLENAGIKGSKVAATRVLYDFPNFHTSRESLKKLKFNTGEILELTVSVDVAGADLLDKAANAAQNLLQQHRMGKQSSLLSYQGCAQITLDIHFQDQKSSIAIPRMGVPKRMLTPSFKSVSIPKISENLFDLRTWLTTKGIYEDSNKDRIPDGLKTSIILSNQGALLPLTNLATRLVLHTAGASFPLVYTEKSHENMDKLSSPILIGQGKETDKLIKTGRLQVPPLKKGWGLFKIIPNAFNKSPAVVILGADPTGLAKTLTYVSRTYPFFERYKDGLLQISDITSSLEDFLSGKNGFAEAYFKEAWKNFLQDIKGKDIESLNVEVYTPKKNTAFCDWLSTTLPEKLTDKSLHLQASSTKDSKTVFKKSEEFPWEGDDVFNLIADRVSELKKADSPLKISIGVSESPTVRKKITEDIKTLLREKGIKKTDIEVLSSYKQGFFWLTERVLPILQTKHIKRILIRFAAEKDDFHKPKRFYSENSRWLQELYPVDDILANHLGLSPDNIEFEIKPDSKPTYEVKAFNDRGRLVYSGSFTVTTRESTYLSVLPEWGTVKLTTGWLKIRSGKETIADITVPSDLEIFWEYYQDEVLSPLYDFIRKTTAGNPTFAKQPYFKRLLVEMWFSEPDYKLGLDEEIISSLESIHDELYFDTLDFLRGITHVKIKDKEVKEDTSRYSAPGNILPIVHPSTEGQKGKVKVTLEDWQVRVPQMLVKWKERGEQPQSRKITLPKLKIKETSVPGFIFNGPDDRMENLFVHLEFAREEDYLKMIDILSSFRDLQEKGIIPPLFQVPKLRTVVLHLTHDKLEKEEPLSAGISKAPSAKIASYTKSYNKSIVPTTEIISPEKCLKLTQELNGFKEIHSYIAGRSYEGRPIPVLEIFRPMEGYISRPRLITFKPTLSISGRQHANEISSTNYILKFAELLATNPDIRTYLNKINFVLHPMENPDGAALAFALQKITPFHSLHAGRYSSLGIDVGYQVNAAKPILPEAKVRNKLYNRWLPDIYLNLHGYPSHEWVQQFSNYSPYLFRDYWIPRGWFAYFRGLSLPLYKSWSRETAELRSRIIQEMTADPKISASNKKLYDRYRRWASRWQPHMNVLELHDGLNLYAGRRSSRESVMNSRRKLTFAEETPELMDETARGSWLDFLCNQGIRYIQAHAKYLSQVKFQVERIEEELQDRIRIRFIRGRPGNTPGRPDSLQEIVKDRTN